MALMVRGVLPDWYVLSINGLSYEHYNAILAAVPQAI
jgi:hypothetical protein